MIGYNDDIVFFSYNTENKNQGSTKPSSELISNSATNENSGSSSSSQSKSSNLQRTESCPAIPEKSGLIRSSSATELPLSSESPLSQSWEEPNRVTLTSVKDRYVSYIISDKMVEIMHQKGYFCEYVNNPKNRCHAFMFDKNVIILLLFNLSTVYVRFEYYFF